jgi:hypothetical protein
MKPIFPINLCKLVDRLFTEFENATTISFAICGTNQHLTIAVLDGAEPLSCINLYEDKFTDDVRPGTAYLASKQDDKITYFVGGFEAVSGLELEKSMKKLRAVIHCCHKGGKVLLNIDDKLLETLKVLNNVF